MKYINYDNAGNLLGFYDDEIHKTIPQPNREITSIEWQDLVEFQSFRKIDPNTKQIIKQEIPVTTVLITPDWSALTNNLRGSALFGKTYAMASQDTRVNAAFTVLLSCINSANPNLDDLQFSLTQLKMLLADILTEEDISTLNDLLIENYFPFNV